MTPLRRHFLLPLLLLPLCAFAMDGAARFDIPAQSLSEALRLFANQGKMQIAYQQDAVSRGISNAVVGEYDRKVALEMLLKDTGYEVVFSKGNAATVRPISTLSFVSGTGDGMQLAQSDGRPIGSESPQSADRQSADSTNEDKSRSGDRSREPEIETIVVTAQKRQERLQDVPISISVMTPEELEAGAFFSLRDALRTTPGITFYENQQASMAARYTVRGVGSNTSLYNGSSTIGFYLEDIPFGFARFPVLPDTNVYDLERVEVLRGPQGTLYGASSLNGVIRVLTADANLDNFDARVRLAGTSVAGGDQGARGDFALNFPIIPGKLAMRAVAGYDDRPGWIDRPALGLRDANGGSSQNYRLKIGARPTDSSRFELLGWFNRDKSDGPNFVGEDGALPWDDRTPNSGGFDAYSMTFGYDLSSFDLTSITSHIKYDSQSYFDLNSTPGVGDLLSTGLSSRLWSQEVRLASTSQGPWRWTAGGMYRDVKDQRFEFFVRHLPPNLGVGNDYFGTESHAVYGELTRLFADDRFELTGGLRYFRDDSYSDETAISILTNADGSPITPYGRANATFSAVTPRAVLTYKRAETNNLYLSYGQGFRSGFTIAGAVLRSNPFAVRSVDPDRLSSYEVGTKGSLGGGLLSYNVAVYYMDWRDNIQVVGVLLQDGTTVNAARNSGTASGWGTDVTATLRPVEELTISVTFSWNGLEFSKNVLADVSTPQGIEQRQVFAKGARLPESPERTTSATISYLVPMGAQYTMDLNASYDYTSKQTAPLNTGAPGLFGESLAQLGATIGLSSQENWSIALFGSNLLDENPRVRVSPTQGLSDRLRPRTIGVQYTQEFR